jgi:hypothetical protein
MLKKLKEKRQQAEESLFCYSLCIDFGWERLQTVRDVAEILFKNGIECFKVGEARPGLGELDDFLLEFEEAKILARKHGWCGSFLYGPCVFSLPSGECGGRDDFCYAFVWKHSDNNGATFVISPIELPWLEEYREN